MVLLDEGSGLRAALRQIARRRQRGTLYVLVPFIETEATTWQSVLTIARAGARVLLFTRPSATDKLTVGIDELARAGGRTTFVSNLHAKAFLWLPHWAQHRVAFIGSHNFTRAAETNSIELGVLIWGEGSTEARIYGALQSVVRGLRSSHPTHGAKHSCGKRK